MESKGGKWVHTGVWGLPWEGVEQISGRGRGSGRPGEAAPHRGMGGCRGHRGDVQGVQDKEIREQSWVKMRGVRVETEQEEPGVTPVIGGGDDWYGLRFSRNHSCALQKIDSKLRTVRVDTSEEATGII